MTVMGVYESSSLRGRIQRVMRRTAKVCAKDPEIELGRLGLFVHE